MGETYIQQATEEWTAQGYAPDQMDLWMMLCGYLDLQGGQRAIGLLPKLLYPLMVDQPRSNAVRQWFGERQALPVEQRPGAYVALLPDWRERLQRMRELESEGRSSMAAIAWGFLPWYVPLDFPDEDDLGEGGGEFTHG